MNPIDIKALKERLIEIAEAIGAKPVGDAGAKAWYIALKDFRIDEALDVLDYWVRTKTKMATPADIRAILSSRLSDRIERKAVQEKAEFAQGAERILADPAIARLHLNKIWSILKSGKTHDPNDWWHAIITKWRQGQPLVYMQLVNARRAWEASGRPPEWAPPQESILRALEAPPSDDQAGPGTQGP